MTVLLITSQPTSLASKQAIVLANHHLEQQKPLSVFFYGNGVTVANRLRWQPDNSYDSTADWIDLHTRFGLLLPVCVSAALARGISDSDNANRHHLDGDNLLPPFYLAGLSELAMLLGDTRPLVQL